MKPFLLLFILSNFTLSFSQSWDSLVVDSSTTVVRKSGLYDHFYFSLSNDEIIPIGVKKGITLDQIGSYFKGKTSFINKPELLEKLNQGQNLLEFKEPNGYSSVIRPYSEISIKMGKYQPIFGYSYHIRIVNNEMVGELVLSARIGIKIVNYLRKRLKKSEELKNAEIILNSVTGEIDAHVLIIYNLDSGRIESIKTRKKEIESTIQPN